MLSNERVVAAIPTRGGSTTVAHKNVRDLAGKPLVAWAIDAALDTPEIDRVIVSTDDESVAAVAREYGAEVIDRPPDLATDDALVADALRHLLGELRREGETARYVAMLEPTSPLRTTADIRACLDLLAGGDHDSAATFTAASLNPHRVWRIDDGTPEPYLAEANPWLPRQRLPEAYELTGAVYAFVADALPDTGASLLFGRPGAVLTPPERAVDIDTERDFALAELLVAEGGDG